MRCFVRAQVCVVMAARSCWALEAPSATFARELATLRAVAQGASAVGRFRPHSRYTSRFGEILKYGAGSDASAAARARSVVERLERNGEARALEEAAALGAGVLGALEGAKLVA